MRRRLPSLLTATALAVGMAACTPAGSPTTGPGPTSNLTLRPTGLGSFDVGDPAAEVIDGISAEIGGWDADSSESDSTMPLPDCGIGDIRIVSWGNLALVFAGSDDSAPFVTWSYGFDPVTGSAEDVRGLGLVTDRGIGLGSTRPDVERAYRGRVSFTDDSAIDVATFTIDGDEAEHLAGRFPTTDPDALLQYIERIPGCTFG